MNCMLSIYLGESVFTIQENLTLLSLFENRLNETDLSPERDEEEREIECQELRRLFLVLMSVVPKLINKNKIDFLDEDDPKETKAKDNFGVD